ncbi:fibrinogen-like YCDxxxxGGGW domain-containing protein [Flavobacterium sp.]|uniref:fibrinogen-like YCDxxxxGGGW domain-containing protein n=1 Tax=Flavobacterium sp. TaxID=239 RepID=UPI0025CDC3BC|nr:fibrinogen-like YCDxxxxGGGW domain-containing protein [Flavobacterium sp.]
MKKKRYILLLVFCSIALNAQSAFQNLAVKKPQLPTTYSFKYTGALQQFVVPNRVTSIQVNAIGAKGGTGANGQVGGAGANITTTLNVTPGQILYVVVGGFSGQSATAKYGFGGNGGVTNIATNYGGAGGGLSGVFNSSIPSTLTALVVAGGGGGGAGHSTDLDYTGGNAGNNSVGTSSDGNEAPVPKASYVTNGRTQVGYAATITTAGNGGYAFDDYANNSGTNGNGINGGAGGGSGNWLGGGGGGAGFYGGGGGAGGGDANGGGGGGATKTTSGFNSFGTLNTTGDGSVTITCLSNSGLVLHLDAGNTASYSGSGITWNDLSGNGSNVTLTSTTYSAANGGAIVFNGTSSYANFTANIGSTNAVTVEMWVKTNSLNAPGGSMYFGFDRYDVWTSNGNIGYNTSNSDQYGIASSTVDYLGIEKNWRHLVFVMNANSKTNNKIYVNGESQGLSQVAGVFGSVNSVFNSGAGRISGWLADTSWKMNIQVASFKVYNRELTPQEITNNFNTTKTRFYAERDGLSPSTASTSAYQIKQDYPSSADGFYWIKNANINGGVPVKIYADMTTDNGGWTLLMKNSSYGGWNYANSMALNIEIPFTTNAEVISTSSVNYSIIGWADYIKKSNTGFQYMIDAGSRNSNGGIWTANGNYSFVNTNNTQTNVTLNTKFGTWNYVGSNNGMAQRMPWRSTTVGAGTGYLTLSDGTGNWWGTLISNNSYYSPSPWISDGGGGSSSPNPGIIWYWVR